MPSIYSTVFGGNAVAPAIPTYLALNISANVILGWPLESNITAPAAAEIIDVTATVPGLTIQLSDARQVGTGYCALFNNIGANSFTLLDAQGNTLMAPAPGQAWQLYISDNSTLQGTWRVFQYGASVSTANAATLAGNGLKAISTTLNERIVINPQATNYIIGSGSGQDRASCVEWTGGSGGTFTAPAPATVGSDWFCYIKNSGTGTLTLSGTIDGSVNKSFNPNDSCILVSDGAALFTMGFGQSVASSFNFVTISLTPPGTGAVVLSGAQLNRISYKFTGALTGNIIVQVPASIQQYWVDNETTGAFTLTISAGGAGSTFSVPQATRVILYCDGLNIVNAVSSGAGSTTLVADGTAAAPGLAWASDTQMGLYKVGTDILGISTAGVQRITINASGAVTVNAPAAGDTLSLSATAVGRLLSGSYSADGECLRVARSGGTNNPFLRLTFTDSTGVALVDAGSSTIFKQLQLGCNSIAAIAINGSGLISGLGPVAAAFVDMTPDTGTFTGTLTGCVTTPNGTCTWSRVGKLVTLFVPGLNGTSNTNACSILGMPAAIQPATLDQIVSIPTFLNGSTTQNNIDVIISHGIGTLTFRVSGSAAGFTTAGTKGTDSGFTISYLLN